MQSLFTVCGLLFLTFSVHARVVENFEGCKKYFYKEFVPQGLNSGNEATICQSLDGYRFATLYNTGHRIPVYSAYVFKHGKDRSDPYWCVEPQLVDPSCDDNMTTTKDLLLSQCGDKVDVGRIGERQAVDEDYITLVSKNKYNRGHLNPKGHHEGLGRDATFTLTNAVPQNRELNSGAWAQYENNVKNIFMSCKKAYVLVGAIPSDNSLANNRVNIPDYLWHAYCCIDKNDKPKSGAATVKNTNESVQKCNLDTLKEFLKKHLKKEEAPVLFFNDCKP